MYKYFRFYILLFLIILTNFEETISNYLTLFFILTDSTYFILFPNEKTKEILIHHFVSYILCITPMSPILMNIHTSSLLAIAPRRCTYMLYPVWVLARLVVMPLVMLHVVQTSELYMYKAAVCYVYLTGVKWTFDFFRIRINPKIFHVLSFALPVSASKVVVTSTMLYSACVRNDRRPWHNILTHAIIQYSSGQIIYWLMV